MEPEHDRMVMMPEACHITGLSASSIERLLRAGDFPPPRILTRLRTRRAWLLSELITWIHGRPVADYSDKTTKETP